jgi:hypothetical protein
MMALQQARFCWGWGFAAAAATGARGAQKNLQRSKRYND